MSERGSRDVERGGGKLPAKTDAVNPSLTHQNDNAADSVRGVVLKCDRLNHFGGTHYSGVAGGASLDSDAGASAAGASEAAPAGGWVASSAGASVAGAPSVSLGAGGTV